MRASAPPTRLLYQKRKKSYPPSHILFFFLLIFSAKVMLLLTVTLKFFLSSLSLYISNLFFFLPFFFPKVKVYGGRIPLAGTQFFGWQMPFFLSWSRKTLFVYLFYFLGTSRIGCFALQIRPVRQSDGQPTPLFRKWKRGEVKL